MNVSMVSAIFWQNSWERFFAMFSRIKVQVRELRRAFLVFTFNKLLSLTDATNIMRQKLLLRMFRSRVLFAQ